jgi:hypothetical protein
VERLSELLVFSAPFAAPACPNPLEQSILLYDRYADHGVHPAIPAPASPACLAKAGGRADQWEDSYGKRTQLHSSPGHHLSGFVLRGARLLVGIDQAPRRGRAWRGFARAGENGNSGYCGIADFSPVEKLEMSTEFVRTLAWREPAIPPGTVRVAVAPSPVIFGSARMLISLRQGMNNEAHVVRSLDAAYKLLGFPSLSFSKLPKQMSQGGT